MSVSIRANTAPRAPTERLFWVSRTIARMFAPAFAKLATSPLAVPRRKMFRWFFFSLMT